MIRVLIVAPYLSVRAGLRALLADTDECEIVGAVSGSDELELLLPELNPDIVLFDENLGELNQILEVIDGTVVGLITLGDTTGDLSLLAASELSAWGYLRKEADGMEIARAIQAVAAGLVVLDRSLSPILRAAMPATRSLTQSEAELPGESLTAREREVIQLMAQGLPNKNIAAQLSISLHTVKYHVASILAKLGATSRTEAVSLGLRRGYISF